MTAEEFYHKITHIVNDARTPDQSRIWSDEFFKELEEEKRLHARLKCLEAIEKTKDTAYNLLEEWCDAGNPNVRIALDKIENIQNESVLSLIK